jgi:acetyltransferase-like isoleucine patch superfamily enzyme
MNFIKQFIKYIAYKYGRMTKLYLFFCSPSPEEYADFLRVSGTCYSIGANCWIMRSTNITDPAYVRLGDNVMLSACSLIGHDGSIHMLNNAYGKKLDKVGKIDIGDNVFIGHQAIVLPGVTIGSNVIVGAGSVVSKDVADNTIVAGVPAKPIAKTDEYVASLEKKTQDLPWYDLLLQRTGSFDAEFEAEIVKRRVTHFYS